MKKRAFTIPEVMISATLLLILIGMASMGTVSFMRGYQKFTKESSGVRSELQTLNKLMRHLRSCQAVKKKFQRLDLSSEPLMISVQTVQGVIEEKLYLKNGELWAEGKTKERLGNATNVTLNCSLTGMLEVQVDSKTAVADWSEALP
jgi:type II secretory pathway component PulJ